MERELSLGVGMGPAETYLLPSRRAALRTCLGGLDAGPVLVTGEPGVGKTWLARRLAAADGAPGRWVEVDLTPATTPADFLRAVAGGLGLDGAGSPGTIRLALAAMLGEGADDGRRFGLRIDEAHLGSIEVLEEARVLANRLGRPDGFAAVVLVGQTPLARRLAGRPLAALESRLAGRVHLRPLDLDEARDLLGRVRPDVLLDRGTLDRVHRDLSGNPGRLLRAFGAGASLPGPDVPAVRSEPVELQPAAHGTSLLGESKPPLVVEDGLIEVGWEPEAAITATAEEFAEPEPDSIPDEDAEIGPTREVVDDRYAALQAWNEWARNQGRKGPEDADEAMASGREPVLRAADAENHWADPGHGFAPYSQLFSRLKQARDTES